MSALLASFIRSESGATALEYAFIASFIAMGCIAALSVVGTHLSAKFSSVASGLN